MSEKILGIDLGTTNSVASIMEVGKPTVIPNKEGEPTTPSIVAYLPDSTNILVGELARRQALLNTPNTYTSIKRFMGRKADNLNQEDKLVSYKVKSGENNRIVLECPAIQKELTPEEISAQILIKLKNDASQYLNEELTKAVITVPAYFNDAQRLATKNAGKIAGLEVLRIINEPTAAALAYGFGKTMQGERILVFDLGGGTFDVSILDVGDGLFEVLSTSGDTRLGGDDFDRVIVDYLLNEIYKEDKTNLQNDKQTLQRLTEAAEKAKKDLSTATETVISLPFFTTDKSKTQNIEIPLTRDHFEKLSESLLERCKTCVLNAIKDAGLNKGELAEVVLVGGSTRMPMIKKLVENLLDKKPNQSVNPDEVVAVGAAIQGAVLSGSVDNILLLDVTPLSLGVETYGGLMTTIIPRNSTIPTERSEFFSTSEDNQPQVEIHVLQGERELARYNKSLGIFKLENIPLAPRGIPQIRVTFDINVDGILSVKAREMNSGLEQAIQIEGSSNLSDSEVQEMINNAKAFAQEDKINKYLIEKINIIESRSLLIKKVLEKDFLAMLINTETQSSVKNLQTKVSELLEKRKASPSVISLENDINQLEKQIKEATDEFYIAIFKKYGQAQYSQPSTETSKEKSAKQDDSTGIIDVQFDDEN